MEQESEKEMIRPFRKLSEGRRMSLKDEFVPAILFMILLNALHPPAVGTSLIFAFRAGEESNLVLFGLAVTMTVMLVLLEQWALWAMVRYTKRANGKKDTASGR